MSLIPVPVVRDLEGPHSGVGIWLLPGASTPVLPFQPVVTFPSLSTPLSPGWASDWCSCGATTHGAIEALASCPCLGDCGLGALRHQVRQPSSEAFLHNTRSLFQRHESPNPSEFQKAIYLALPDRYGAPPTNFHLLWFPLLSPTGWSSLPSCEDRRAAHPSPEGPNLAPPHLYLRAWPVRQRCSLPICNSLT